MTRSVYIFPISQQLFYIVENNKQGFLNMLKTPNTLDYNSEIITKNSIRYLVYVKHCNSVTHNRYFLVAAILLMEPDHTQT